MFLQGCLDTELLWFDAVSWLKRERFWQWASKTAWFVAALLDACKFWLFKVHHLHQLFYSFPRHDAEILMSLYLSMGVKYVSSPRSCSVPLRWHSGISDTFEWNRPPVPPVEAHAFIMKCYSIHFPLQKNSKLTGAAIEQEFLLSGSSPRFVCKPSWLGGIDGGKRYSERHLLFCFPL